VSGFIHLRFCFVLLEIQSDLRQLADLGDLVAAATSEQMRIEAEIVNKESCELRVALI